MKKYVVTIVFVVAALVPSAFAVNSQLNSRVTRLERQVRTLNTQVRALTTRVRNVEGFAGCITSSTIVPMAAFGNPPSEGFVYRSPTQGEFLTSAVDLVGQGETPQFRVATVNPQCVGSSARSAAQASPRAKRDARGKPWKRALPTSLR